jgi:hypothetical protein
MKVFIEGDTFVESINILFEKPFQFFPNMNSSFEEQLNVVMKASIYIAIGISIYRRSLYPLILPILVLLGIVIVYQLYKLRKRKENKERFSLIGSNTYKFTEPTEDNPYMNYLITNIDDDQKNPKDYIRKSKPLYKKNVSQNVDNILNNQFINDPTDVFNKTQSQRQFVTYANTDIVNDQDAFLKAMSKDATHCKDNNGDCHRGI